MKRPNPHGRSVLLIAGGKPATEQPSPPSGEDAENFTPRLKAKPHSPGIPLGHGKHSEQQVAAWDAEGKRRREGNCRIPSWQLTIRAGCVRCMAPTGIPPLEAGEARLRLEGRGWVFRGGMWLCAACDREGV